MKHRTQFKAGIALLTVYGVLNFRFALPFYSPSPPQFPGNWLSTLLEYLLYDPVVSPMVGRLSAIFGFILLFSHYHHADAKERQVYRILDGVSALLLGAFAGLMLIFFRLLIREPSLHIGFLLMLQLALLVFLTIAVVLWAYALWRARAGMALLFSVLCVALIFSPELPYNNPHYLDESQAYWLQQHGENGENEHTAPVESDNTNAIDYTQTVIFEERLELLAFPLLLAYTWMRWGGLYKKDDDMTRAASA